MAQEDYGTDLLVYSCRRNTSAGRFAGTGCLSGVNVYAACFIVSNRPTEVECTLTCLAYRFQ